VELVSVQVRLQRKIGTGGFGCVYLGVYRDHSVAVKRLHRSVNNSLATLESFRAECRVVHLKHPNIVRVLAATAGGLPGQLLGCGGGGGGGGDVGRGRASVAAARAALRCGVTAAVPSAAAAAAAAAAGLLNVASRLRYGIFTDISSSYFDNVY